jgi:hypothetical protein
MEERDVDQFDYALLGEDTIDRARCWKIQSIPKQSKSSQYTKLILWVRMDNYAFAQTDSYINAQVVRRLSSSDIRNVQGIWTAHEMVMADLRRGSKTRLALDKIEYNLPLKEDRFTLQAIRRP